MTKLDKDQLTDLLHKTFITALKNKNSKDIFNKYKELAKTNGIIPKKLYRYLGVSNLNPLNAVLKKRLYLSDYEAFNDPLDCILLKKVKETVIRNKNYNRDEVISMAKSNRICCLSEINPSSIDSFLMWSHYANGHRGICLEYDTVTLLNRLECLNIDEKISFLLPVAYISDINEEIQKLTALGSGAWITALFHKLKAWEYEQEWRILYGHREVNYIDDILPTKIYIGCENNTSNLLNALFPLIESEQINQKQFYKHT